MKRFNIDVKIKSLVCPVCKTQVEISVNLNDFLTYKRIDDIAKAFPYIDKNILERFITGLHDKCWDIYIGV